MSWAGLARSALGARTWIERGPAEGISGHSSHPVAAHRSSWLLEEGGLLQASLPLVNLDLMMCLCDRRRTAACIRVAVSDKVASHP